MSKPCGSSILSVSVFVTMAPKKTRKAMASKPPEMPESLQKIQHEHWGRLLALAQRLLSEKGVHLFIGQKGKLMTAKQFKREFASVNPDLHCYAGFWVYDWQPRRMPLAKEAAKSSLRRVQPSQ